MIILPVIKGIQNDIFFASCRLRNAAAEGYNIAERTSKIYKQGHVKKYVNVTRSVTDKVAKNTTKQELPYIAGAIGMIIPLPLMSPIFFGIGLIARFALSERKGHRSNNIDVNA